MQSPLEATASQRQLHLATGKGAMVMHPGHYQGLVRRPRGRPPSTPPRELITGPGVGQHFVVPEEEVRPLAIYEEVSYVAAI